MKTWTLSERLVTKKPYSPKALRVNLLLIRTYLVVVPLPAQPSSQRKARGRYRAHGSKYISVPQATNLIEAVDFAKSIDLPLVAHLTIHWSGTVAFDDHEGARFAKVREG